jgi:hypothetical protein
MRDVAIETGENFSGSFLICTLHQTAYYYANKIKDSDNAGNPPHHGEMRHVLRCSELSSGLYCRVK